MLSDLKPTLVLVALSFFVPIFTSQASSTVSTDSVGVEKQNGQSFILHEVDPKETLFGISRRYNSPVGEIIDANPVLKSGLKIGQRIRVPFIPVAALPDGAKLHNVGPGETLFSISKKYEVTVDQLKLWNELLGNDLSIGQGLIIKNVAAPQASPAEVASAANQEAPIKAATTVTTAAEVKKPTAEKAVPREANKTEKAAKERVEKPVQKATESSVNLSEEDGPVLKGDEKPLVPGDWVSHTVQPGETLFALANRYNARVEDLITWNALSSNNVKEGQVLRVGRGPLQESTVPVYGQPKVVSSIEEADASMTSTASSGGFKNIKETGKAELIEGTGSHKKYLVLHRTAPIGTIMRVKNEENDVTIFARVVGTLPETGDNASLLIKLSQAAFDQLKAVNGRFPVEVMY